MNVQIDYRWAQFAAELVALAPDVILSTVDRQSERRSVTAGDPHGAGRVRHHIHVRSVHQGGMLRALAVTTATRSDVLPGIPTIAESAAELVERRAETKGNANQQSTCRMSQALERI